jgi:KR domain
VYQAPLHPVLSCFSHMAVLQGVSPLTSVLHAGGALADALLPDQTAAGVRTAFAAKAFGAAALADLTAAAPLTGLQLFSSLSGTLGNAGQANYAAANGILDSLASRLQVRTHGITLHTQANTC